MNKQEFEFCVRFRELGASEVTLISELIGKKYIAESCENIAKRHDGKTKTSICGAAERLSAAGIITWAPTGGKTSVRMMFLNENWEETLMNTPCELTKQPLRGRRKTDEYDFELDALYEKLKKND